MIVYTLTKNILDGDYLPNSYDSVIVSKSFNTLYNDVVDELKTKCIQWAKDLDLLDRKPLKKFLEDITLPSSKKRQIIINVTKQKIIKKHNGNDDDDQELTFSVDENDISYENNSCDNHNRYYAIRWKIREHKID